jgi:FtsP/CotA-like multicopper oxidase with cupredoxin domain
VGKAVLMTRKVDTGPDGDNDPARVIASIDPHNQAMQPLDVLPSPSSQPVFSKRFQGLANEKPGKTREIGFSEVLQNPSDPTSPTDFFITESGAKPLVFHMGDAPAITVTQGSTEDWVVSNQTKETHVFHIHQIHFLLLERNGVSVPQEEQQFLDTVEVPYWKGVGPYPSVKLRMDFRGADVGDFVYHCHILQHEDAGMMATLRVLPK